MFIWDGGRTAPVVVVVCVAVTIGSCGTAPGCGGGGPDDNDAVGAGPGCGSAPGCGAGGAEGSEGGRLVVLVGCGTGSCSGCAVFGVTPSRWRGASA